MSSQIYVFKKFSFKIRECTNSASNWFTAFFTNGLPQKLHISPIVMLFHFGQMVLTAIGTSNEKKIGQNFIRISLLQIEKFNFEDIPKVKKKSRVGNLHKFQTIEIPTIGVWSIGSSSCV